MSLVVSVAGSCRLCSADGQQRRVCFPHDRSKDAVPAGAAIGQSET